jgi:glycosyltransferase involved in cell wall biosynthesis
VSRVLVLSSEPVGAAMAGPAIRATELARVLGDAGHEVHLATSPAGDHDIVVAQGWALERHPAVTESSSHLVIDLYDPFDLELLHLLGGRAAPERRQAQANAMRALHDQARAGDFFLSSSERQRDYWLGYLNALGRVNPATHAADPTLRGLIDVLPFGVPGEPPERSGPGMREQLGLSPDDVVLLWGGGVYDWFDPVTVVRAVERVEGVHLVFMSAQHANPDLPTAHALEEARREAGERVHFNEQWVPYESRADWLLDADVGVSAHRDDVETRFAFRTRVLDYLWAGLPVLCTAGDALADEVERRDLGAALAPGDVDGWTEAIAGLARDPQRRAACGARAADYARSLTWERVAGPLLAYCAAPRRAPDLAAGGPLRPTRDGILSRRRLGALARRLRGS